MKFWERDAFTYAVIVLACIASLAAIVGYSFPKPDVMEMSLKAYPSQASAGASASFTLALANHGAKPRNYTLDVYLDETLKASRDVALAPASSQDEPLSVSLAGAARGSHRVTVRLYDPGASYIVYGSREQPYYVFFTLKVV